jgi:WD40 repeat protein
MSTPTPLFVLRGHRSPIHTITFCNAQAAEASAGASAAAASSALVRATPASGPASRPPATAALPRLLSGDSAGQVMVWDLATRRSVLKLAAHTGPVLAVHALSDGKLISQGNDGLGKFWDVNSSTTAPVHTIETESYTFFKSQVVEMTPRWERSNAASSSFVVTAASGASPPSDSLSSSSTISPLPSSSYPSSPLLLLPCETASNMSLYDLRASATKEVQLLEIEQRIPRDPHIEENFRSRLHQKEIDELDDLLAKQPPQYERKVGMAMAARFFQPGEDETSAPSMDRLNIAWASEAGVVGVWDIRAGKHLFQQTLHKETLLSFDVTWSGRYGVSCSSSSDILAWSLDPVSSSIRVLGSITVPHEGQAEVVLREDGRLFATAGWDHRVRLFDSTTLAPLAILKEHTETVQCVAMPPRSPAIEGASSNEKQAHASSGYIASGAKDGKIAVYQLYASDGSTALTTPAGRGVSVLQAHEQIYERQAATKAEAASTAPATNTSSISSSATTALVSLPD